VSDTEEQQTRIAELIGQVYDAALDESLWSGLAPKIAHAFGSHSTTVHTVALERADVRFLDMTENIAANMESYRAYYWQHDLLANGAAKAGLGQVFIGTELVSESDLIRTEFYNDFVRRCDQFHLVGSVFPVASGELGVLGVHRPRDAQAFTGDEKQRVELFLPHLQRALQLRHHLADLSLERGAALDGLERSGTATLVVARDGRVLYANTQAEALLRQGDALHSTGGRLVTNDRAVSERLRRAIEGAVDAAAEQGGSPGGVLAIRRADKLPLTVLVAPFRPARDGFGAVVPAAILFIRDPEGATISSLALQGLFGLTPSEAAVASALADGKAITAIAAANRISLNTARTHLKNILAKTGTSRQAELVALLLRSVAALVPR